MFDVSLIVGKCKIQVRQVFTVCERWQCLVSAVIAYRCCEDSLILLVAGCSGMTLASFYVLSLQNHRCL